MSATDVPYGFIKGNDLYLSAWGDQKDRKIGEVKDDLASAVQYFQNKFQDLEGKILDLFKLIELAENKGSYLMKLVHLKELLHSHDGLGDYALLLKTLEKHEENLGELIGKNRERNSEIKLALFEELKIAVDLINWTESTEKVQDVKSRWLKTGNAREDLHEQLEADFWDCVQAFFDKKKAFYEDKRRLTDIRKKKYEMLIESSKELAGLKGKERFDRVKELKAEWGGVGNISAREYKDLQFQFNSALKGMKELPTPDFGRIKVELEKMYDRTILVDKEMLQRFRKSLGAFKTRNPELKATRHSIMERINIIWERDFLENLAGKKNRNFDKLDSQAKSEIMIKLLREFIYRDKADLTQYEENSEKFAGHDQNTNRMLERKLGQQRNKIVVKEKLLKILEEKEA